MKIEENTGDGGEKRGNSLGICVFPILYMEEGITFSTNFGKAIPPPARLGIWTLSLTDPNLLDTQGRLL